jgi:hypothetical protein
MRHVVNSLYTSALTLKECSSLLYTGFVCFMWSYNEQRLTDRYFNVDTVCFREAGLTREWSDPTCRNLPCFFFFSLQEYTQQNTLSKF